MVFEGHSLVLFAATVGIGSGLARQLAPLGGRLVLLPYLVWVSFASALNLAIWRLNS